MNKLLSFVILFFTFSGLMINDLQSQKKIPFGEISYQDLNNPRYEPDPGAEAIILSDEGIATLNYDGDEFYIELFRDVKIRIVNSNGFDYANIELPFYSDDVIINYRASTFNLRNNEKAETVIPKKDFIIDRSNDLIKTLKFNFPDVHEGSVIEYSYTVRLIDDAIYVLVPWKFQSDIPVIRSSLTVKYPEYFTYKYIISGSSKSVLTTSSSSESYYFNGRMNANVITLYVKDMPAFRDEPFTKSTIENITKINFELSSVNLPGSSLEEITPTYSTLTEKLLERSDFGLTLTKTKFLKKKTLELTAGLDNDLSRLMKIHEFISDKILWNGTEDFVTSASLKNVFNKEKGSSADINMILIGMLRAIGIKADPVILSTRSNGNINEHSAMIQQFNYIVAQVYIGDKYYLVDATDPLRPFNVLPFNCLNGKGRLIDAYASKFVDLSNNETMASLATASLLVDGNGNLSGTIKTRYSDFEAYSLRRLISLEGKDGYLDLIKDSETELEISDFDIQNLTKRDSDVVETFKIDLRKGTQAAGNRLLLNPFFSHLKVKNNFNDENRKYKIDFGAPIIDNVSIEIEIPEGFSVVEMPSDLTNKIGSNDAVFEFTCQHNQNKIIINSLMRINKTTFQPSEYRTIQNFFLTIIKKQAELIVIEKTINI